MSSIIVFRMDTSLDLVGEILLYVNKSIVLFCSVIVSSCVALITLIIKVLKCITSQ